MVVEAVNVVSVEADPRLELLRPARRLRTSGIAAVAAGTRSTKIGGWEKIAQRYNQNFQPVKLMPWRGSDLTKQDAERCGVLLNRGPLQLPGAAPDVQAAGGTPVAGQGAGQPVAAQLQCLQSREAARPVAPRGRQLTCTRVASTSRYRPVLWCMIITAIQSNQFRSHPRRSRAP